MSDKKNENEVLDEKEILEEFNNLSEEEAFEILKESGFVNENTESKELKIEVFSNTEGPEKNPLFVSTDEIMADLEKKFGKEFIEDLDEE